MTVANWEALVADAADAAINAGCKMIQDALGVTSGDAAAMFFDGAEADAIRAAFARYLSCEVKQEDSATMVLLRRLQAAYPTHEFDLSDKQHLCPDVEQAPPWLITFTAPQGVCIYDPLLDESGFSASDPQAEYGITREDAEAIRAHNVATAG